LKTVTIKTKADAGVDGLLDFEVTGQLRRAPSSPSPVAIAKEL
jgi:hypothetical protein